MSCKRDFRWRAISPRPLFFFLFASRSSRSSSRIIDPPLQLEFLTVSAEDLLKTTTAIAVSVLLPRVAKRTVIFRLLNELLSPLSKHTPRVFFPSPSPRREGHGVLYGACISVCGGTAEFIAATRLPAGLRVFDRTIVSSNESVIFSI